MVNATMHVGFEPPTFDIHGSASFQTQMISSFARRTLFKYALDKGAQLEVVWLDHAR